MASADSRRHRATTSAGSAAAGAPEPREDGFERGELRAWRGRPRARRARSSAGTRCACRAGGATGRRNQARAARLPLVVARQIVRGGPAPVSEPRGSMKVAVGERVEGAIGEWARERPHAADLAVGRERLHDRPAVARLARDEREAHRLRECQLGRGHRYRPAARRQWASRAARGERLVVVVPVVDVVDRPPRDLAHLVRLRVGARRRSLEQRYTTDTVLCGLPSTPASRANTPTSRVDAAVEPDLLGELAHHGLLRASRWGRPSPR